MKRVALWAGLVGGLLAAALMLWPSPEPAVAPDTPDAVEAWLAAHPDRYALAAWDVGDEAHGLFHDADTAWPLASTVKIIHLALASEEIAAGRWSLHDPTPEVSDLLAGHRRRRPPRR